MAHKTANKYIELVAIIYNRLIIAEESAYSFVLRKGAGVEPEHLKEHFRSTESGVGELIVQERNL